MILIGYSSGGFKPFWIFKPNPGSAMYVPKTEEFPEYPCLGFLKWMFLHFFRQRLQRRYSKTQDLWSLNPPWNPSSLRSTRQLCFVRVKRSCLSGMNGKRPSPMTFRPFGKNGKENPVRYRTNVDENRCCCWLRLVWFVFFFVPSFSPLAKKRGNNLKKQSPPKNGGWIFGRDWEAEKNKWKTVHVWKA